MHAKSFFYVTLGMLAIAASYHLGAGAATAQAPGPAIATGTFDLGDGQRVPMPTYPDGSPALPSECAYAVAGFTGQFAFPSPYVVEGVHFAVVNGNTNPTVEAAIYNEQGRWFSATASVTVIALRGSAPTAARAQSFGSLKARYR